jgi:adenylate cyclase
MKKKPLWLTALPVIAIASVFQVTFDLGEQGNLDSQFLRERIYPIAQSVNGMMTNIKFRLRGPRKSENKIVIVEADDNSVNVLGRWPWHREVYAQLIDTIFSMGANSLALDVAFSEPEDRIPHEVYESLGSNQKLINQLKNFEGDPVLGKVVSHYRDRLVLGYSSDLECQPKYFSLADCPVNDPALIEDLSSQISKFSLRQEYPFDGDFITKSPFKHFLRVFSNIAILREAAEHSGFFGVDPDTDGYIRRYSLVSMSDRKIYPSLALELAQIAKKDKIQVEFGKDGLIRKTYFKNDPNHPVPVTPLGYMNLNFKGPSRTFRYIPVLDIFRALETKDPEILAALKDANVFFGVSAVGIYDMRAFPFDSNTPGVEGHATAFDNLMSGDQLRSASALDLKWLPLALLICLGLLFALSFSFMEAIPSVIVFVGFMTLLGWIDLNLLFSKNINIPTAFLVLEILVIFALILSIRYILEERNKKFVREAFSKYLAPQVVDLVLEDPSRLTVGGERKEITILFSDLRGFTSFSEDMDPKTLTQFLNEYLSEMTDIIFEHQGTLDKYIGDAIMAFWGAPLDQPDQVNLAWSASVAMTKRLREIAPDFKARYGIDVSAGIGINSGVVSVGNMGSKRIFEYTVIGDHVNLASRLESLTRTYGCDILSTKDSLERIPEGDREKFHWRLLDTVKVKGKRNAVDILQVTAAPIPTEVNSKFNEARNCFKNRDWATAKNLFLEASELSMKLTGATDGPSLTFSELCDEFMQAPPDENWDGSIEMKKK